METNHLKADFTAPAKLPWETPLCLPLDVGEGTEKTIFSVVEQTPRSGPAS